MDEKGQLEVLSEMPDGSYAAAGVSVESFLDEVTKASPWLLAPVKGSGAGSSVGPTSAPKNEKGADPFFDRRPLHKRLTR